MKSSISSILRVVSLGTKTIETSDILRKVIRREIENFSAIKRWGVVENVGVVLSPFQIVNVNLCQTILRINSNSLLINTSTLPTFSHQLSEFIALNAFTFIIAFITILWAFVALVVFLIKSSFIRYCTTILDTAYLPCTNLIHVESWITFLTLCWVQANRTIFWALLTLIWILIHILPVFALYRDTLTRILIKDLAFFANAIIFMVTIFAFIRAFFLTRTIINVAFLASWFAWATFSIFQICTLWAWICLWHAKWSIVLVCNNIKPWITFLTRTFIITFNAILGAIFAFVVPQWILGNMLTLRTIINASFSWKVPII